MTEPLTERHEIDPPVQVYVPPQHRKAFHKELSGHHIHWLKAILLHTGTGEQMYLIAIAERGIWYHPDCVDLESA